MPTGGADRSDASLVPGENIVFGGAGANRTVTLTPVGNRFGVVTINVVVSDGTNSVNVYFVLTVMPRADALSVTDSIAAINTQTDSGLVATRNAVDGGEVTQVL